MGGFIEAFKDAFDDVRTLHLHITEGQLCQLYDRTPAAAKTLVLTLDIPDRLLATWMDIYYKRTDYHYSRLMSDGDVRRTVRDHLADVDRGASLGYLLRIQVPFADIVKMHHNNRLRVETVLRVELKSRPLKECWRFRGEPKPWKESAMVAAAPEASTSERSTFSQSASTARYSAPTQQSSSTWPTASTWPTSASRHSAFTQESTSTWPTAPSQSATSGQTIRRKPVPPSTRSTATARTALTVSALASMSTLRHEDSQTNAGR